MNNISTNALTNSIIPVRHKRLNQSYQNTARLLQILLDYVVVLGLFYLHTVLKVGEFASSYRILMVVIFLVMGFIYQAMGVYNFSGSLFGKVYALGKAWLITLMTLILIGFVTKTSTIYSREIILAWGVTAFVGQCLTYLLVLWIQSHYQSAPSLALLVGADMLGSHLAKNINRNPWLNEHIVGVLEDNVQLSEKWNSKDIPVLGTLQNLQDLLDKKDIKRVYLALPLDQAGLIKPIYKTLVEQNIDVIWAPDIFGINLMNHNVKEIAGVPLICLSETPLIGSSAFIKRALDLVLTSVGMIFVLPFMGLVALAIKLTSRGPVIFKQQRHGWDGEIITIYKFRSMYLHDEDKGQLSQATKQDDRVTPVGKFIRRTSLDELPQLFNVLKGEMSLVGPRPHALVHNVQYQQQINAYMTRHRVKPGISGLAQVNGYRGETCELEQMETRVRYDLAYINNWSILLDLQILFKTAFVLLGKNAY